MVSECVLMLELGSGICMGQCNDPSVERVGGARRLRPVGNNPW